MTHTGSPLRIGTRASRLAIWQAHHVAAQIGARKAGRPTELVEIRTQGDAILDVPLWQVDGKAFFTRELDRALADGRIDLAVHSLKDLPTDLAPGLAIGAVLERGDPRDALVAMTPCTLADLPAGSRVGTSSLRRRAFVAMLRPDLNLVDLRGNVPSRIARLERGELDAAILACAGLIRLDLAETIRETLDPLLFPPAPGQGAIAVTARADDLPTMALLAALDHSPSRRMTAAERAVLARLQGGCHAPLGVHAREADGRMVLHALLCAPDGSRPTRVQADAPVAEALALAASVADRLLAAFGPIPPLRDFPADGD